ncbi:sulfur relay protein DsrC [Longibacter salinarum]|uniref:Sulfur relay protein DsrC n=1 Tax=Longibacter salinarum TaxID=1850348 RepID=A0A2A8CVU9_9BACT|nr:TusE/DsrC/DsvC family sulfur relay protein [Longibacter salinarum]PEN12518.1 sulfur relay protein DsrC [Longibacter salinarum]
MDVQLAGQTVALDAEGYLQNMSDWIPEMAREIAAVEEIDLTDKHWDVINFLREQEESGAKLTIRRVGKSGIVSIKEFYDLFPGGPLKISSKIAGIPKPASCV